METFELVIIAAGIFGFALVSRRTEQGLLTSPIVFVLFGFLTSPDILNLVHFSLRTAPLRTLAEITLVLALFIDASRIDLRRLNAEHDLPLRLLGIGLPLIMAAGTGLALLFFPNLGLWEACLIGVILAPTDAALGQAVINNEQVPVRIRQTLNVESGLNDGLAFPVLLILLSLASISTDHRSTADWGLFVGRQLIFGPLVGVGVGLAGAYLVERASDRRWIEKTFLRISVLALALLAFGCAELVEGNGFIAAFSAGIAVGTRPKVLREPLEDFGETEGQLLNLIVFFIFGSSMLPQAIRELAWIDIAYAVLSLTAVRMIPASLSLAGTGLKAATHVFLGWFGPRGLASIIYLLLVVENGGIDAAGDLSVTVITTVFLSVLLHGFTAAPAARKYGRSMTRLKQEDHRPEHRHVSSFSLRYPKRKG